jgi:hypothetical protein
MKGGACLAGYPATSKIAGMTTEFDAACASAVFFKLPCLKLFDHDKMNGFSAGPGAYV